MTKDEALTLEALKYAASKGHGRIVREIKIAPFTIKGDEALAQPEQEPVALVIDGVLVKSALPEKYTGHLYTTPPQRTWVYLTDEHIKEIVGRHGEMPIKGYTRELFDRIEAKSKELNT